MYIYPRSDEVYLQAAAVFQQLRPEKPATHQLLQYGKKTDMPAVESGDKAAREQAYQLAFNTLKYQDLLEDVIRDSCFNTSQHIGSDLLPLAMVMLFDFQDRKFLLRKRPAKEGQEVIQEVKELENSLQKWKTKLAASLARFRVKQNLRSVSLFLTDSVRTKQHRAKSLPVYAWINTRMASVDEVCDTLRSAGLSEAESMTDLTESTFSRDPLCPDTLVFPQHLHAAIQHSPLSTTHVLNIQDRSVCVAVSVLQPLLFEKGDVLVAGSFSAVTAAHIAVVSAARSGRVLVCGADHSPSQVQEMQEQHAQMDIENVEVLSEAFCDLKEWDASVERLKVIIVLPRCSSSALSDPVAVMHSEHGDWDLLPDLSHGSVSKSKLQALTSQQKRLLEHALTFSKVQTVVYCTRSVYPEENEQLVGKALEKTHTHPKLLPFRLNGPIFPGDATDTKFFRLQPSQLTNGCFVARLSRQADPTKVETVQDVLARAAAKGLLGGIVPKPKTKNGKKGKTKTNGDASSTSKSSSPLSQERQAGGEPGEGQDPVTASEPEEEKDEGDAGDPGDNGGEKESDMGGKRRRRKRMANKHLKQTKLDTTVQKEQGQKKPTRRKVKKTQRTRSKPRRIPRLTLTLISSTKPSSQLSLITAVAHKISGNPVIKSQQTDLNSPSLPGKRPSPAHPAPPTTHAASRRQSSQSGEEKTQRTIRKPGRQAPKPENGAIPREMSRPADLVLPPISSPSSGSPAGRSGSPVSQPPSLTSGSRAGNTSASSSTIFLPGL
ncbi:putative methyltransferase NSUN7 [Cololabis saira]|uniref:putative methyltransferase NSUN7 n=1 Tax=Cololabis saira TaxID=129043 RepID=UPI002AD59831|nr:putative methyltransferase NSUN7 [Cololabis saira]